MGEFLSTPIKEKVSDDGENSLVSNKPQPIFYLNYKYSYVLAHAACKVGVKEWKIPT